MKKKRTRIDWDNIKVTFVKADMDNLNPTSHLTPAERREEIIDISASIWMRHCREKLERENDQLCHQIFSGEILNL